MTTKRRTALMKNTLMFLVLMVLPFLSNFINKITPKVYAVGGTPMLITNFSDQVSTMTAATAANHTFTWTTSNDVIPTGLTSLTVTFPSAWTGLSTIAVGDVQIQNTTTSYIWPLTSAASSGTQYLYIVLNSPTAPGAGDVLTLKIGTNVSGGTHQITNPAAGTYLISFSAPWISTDNLNKTGVVFITTGQVSLTAAVEPQLTFTLTNTTLLFESLTVGTPKCATTLNYYTTPSNHSGGACPTAAAGTANFSVSTNGKNGNVITIQDVNNGLKGTANPTSIITATSAVSGATTKFYSYGVITTAQSGFSLDAGFNGTGGNLAISSTAQRFAFSTGPIDPAVGYIEFGSVIVGTTPADTSYTDTVTIICTGQY